MILAISLYTCHRALNLKPNIAIKSVIDRAVSYMLMPTVYHNNFVSPLFHFLSCFGASKKEKYTKKSKQKKIENRRWW